MDESLVFAGVECNGSIGQQRYQYSGTEDSNAKVVAIGQEDGAIDRFPAALGMRYLTLRLEL